MNWLYEQVRIFLIGQMFLTRLPTPAWVGYSDALLARSTVYFPLIGACVGAFGAAAYLLTLAWWPPTLAVLCSIAATIWITGAFHEDGLADTFDGIGGGWTPDAMITIMKDSRMGTYGTVALLLVIAAKWNALSMLPAPVAWRAMLVGHVLGRWSSLPLIWWLPYVHHSQSKSKPFAASVTLARLVAGSLLSLLCCLLIGTLLPWIICAALGVVVGGGWYVKRKLGGITGDVLGALNQLTELSAYLIITAFI